MFKKKYPERHAERQIWVMTVTFTRLFLLWQLNINESQSPIWINQKWSLLRISEMRGGITVNVEWSQLQLWSWSDQRRNWLVTKLCTAAESLISEVNHREGIRSIVLLQCNSKIGIYYFLSLLWVKERALTSCFLKLGVSVSCGLQRSAQTL